jgi:DNA repair protein RadD
MSRLRPYQASLKASAFEHWAQGHRNVLLGGATGSGKTVTLADIVKTANRAAAVIAHRSELVTQISTALAREGVRHRIIGAATTQRDAVTLHMDAFKRSFVDPNARVGVCGVDTLVGRAPDAWFSQVGLWVQDEAHHVLRENKWGRAAGMFPNAYGLGVTATPERADGKGLGREADGIFDVLVPSPMSMRELIDAGYLTDYRIYAPKSDVDYSAVTVTASGDYSPAKLRAAVHSSASLVGDVVGHYMRLAMGKLGVTFAVDVEEAQKYAKAFNAAGVPAEVVSAETPALIRAAILKRFKRREILQLVNVDLFGEGFDLPAIEVVIMARKTESFPLFAQQFGRVLRLMISEERMRNWDSFTAEERRAHIAQSGKPFGMIIDHVGNVIRHGVPDAPRINSLSARERRSAGASDAIPLRACLNPMCARTYERYLRACPYCGHYPEPAARTAPEYVEGDLYELTPETLAALRGRVAEVSGAPRIPHGVSPIVERAIYNRQAERREAVADLRDAIALWAGWQRAQGRDDSYAYRAFFHSFGVDVLTAQTLPRAESEELRTRIQTVLDRKGVISQ